MLKTIKKVILSALSVLGVSFLICVVMMLNPNLVYSSSTQFDNVTVYHNTELDPESESVILGAVELIKKSSIYNPDIQISMCMNDGTFYPELYPFAAATAYAFLDKTVIYDSQPNFKDNKIEFTWPINNNETRAYDFTYLMAHEFMHNVQYDHNPKYQIMSTLGKINWKLEGHADYIARSFKYDGQLIGKIDNYLIQERKAHVGVPVFQLENGTIQNLWYYKCALVIQYLMEEKDMSYDAVCELESGLDELYDEMITWKDTKI